MLVAGFVLLSNDHWADPGGRSLDSLEALIEQHTGQPYSIDELRLISSVDEMRALVLVTSTN